MPGGYARISAGENAQALAMQQGGKVADVWVTNTTSTDIQTPRALGAVTLARASTHNILPSRAADNLFWLGRYVERSEQNMRLFRAYYARISDGAAHDDVMPAFMRAQMMDAVAPNAREIAKRFAAPLVLGLQSASRISDRFSPDGMMALRSLVRDIEALDKRPVPIDSIPVEVSGLLRQITGFAGLVHENMYRSDGWRFLSLGVSLERAANMCSVLAICAADDAPTGASDLALEIGDSVISHRARFTVLENLPSVIDILALDGQNPRSVRYHISRAKDHISHLPQQQSGTVLTEVARLVLIAETRLATSLPSDITPALLIQMQQDIWDISNALNEHHLV